MKWETLKILAIIFTVAIFSSGCAHRVVVHERVEAAPPREVVVTAEPPPPRHEVVTVAPGPGYVWQDGYWVRSHDRWVWVKGHYEVGPHAGAVWVKGHWDRAPHGWVWVQGHWA